jgi:outer membrane protein OmpA-like peptidoglycan-associated protein/uncharacterized protein (UPF0332 family)
MSQATVPFLRSSLHLKMNWNRHKSIRTARCIARFFLLMLGVQNATAQDDTCLDSQNDKVLRLIEKAQNASKYDRSERIAFIEQAYSKDEECMQCLLEWGKLEFAAAKKTGSSFYAAKEPLLELIGLCPHYHADVSYMLGAMEFADRNYEEAQAYFDAYRYFPSDAPQKLGKRYDKQLIEVEQVLPIIQFQMDFMRHENDFTPKVIQEISFYEDEFLPALSPDGSLLFFTRRGKAKAKGDVLTREVETFNMSIRGNDSPVFEPDVALESPFNTGMRYGGASISIDNLELYIAAQNPTATNPNNIDLFMTQYEVLDRDDDGNYLYLWGELSPISNVNTNEGWEAQPALSADGKQLYYASVNEHSIKDDAGNPTMDIWITERNDAGEWGKPHLMPRPINSKFNDKAPFLHPDGNTLYFSSDRSPSGGGYDIWYCHRDSTGHWEDAKNLGAPVNTEGDEHGLVVSTDGEEAFFASRRPGTKGLDILQFPVPEEFKPEEVRVVKGALQATDGGIPPGALLYLQYAKSKRIETIEINEDDGRFAAIVRLDQGEDVLLISEAEGLAFEASVIVDIDQPNPSGSALIAPIVLEQPKNGEAFEIGDIQYATSSAEIDRTSIIILEAFAAYLTRNEALGVHIIGHTDDVGPEEDNLILSERRAEAVARTLATFGVPLERITSDGLGESSPIVPNVDVQSRAQNRRTEFEITLDN